MEGPACEGKPFLPRKPRTARRASRSGGGLRTDDRSTARLRWTPRGKRPQPQRGSSLARPSARPARGRAHRSRFMRATLDLARRVRHCIKEEAPFLDSCLEIVVCHRRCCMARTRARLSGRPACRSGVICPGLSAPQGWPLAARAGCPYSGALGRLDHAGAYGWHVGVVLRPACGASIVG